VIEKAKKKKRIGGKTKKTCAEFCPSALFLAEKYWERKEKEVEKGKERKENFP